MEVLRSEIHLINKNHRLFKYCDEVTFKSKNLYNYANYIIRQEFINNNKILSAFDMNKRLKNDDVFKALPAKTSQQIIIQLGQNWKSFIKSIKDWTKNKVKYSGRPRLPKYKEKNGRNIAFYDYQQGTIKNGRFKFPLTDQFIETKVLKEHFRQIKIIPFGNCYKVIVVYRKIIKDDEQSNDRYLAIDLGVDNLATLTNNIGLTPIVINGKILKSKNQYYNKKLAKLKSFVGNKTSKRIQKLTIKRNNIFDTYIHKVSRFIVNYCDNNQIGNIVIGNNNDWKRRSKMSKEVNQKFIQIPYDKLINHIQYKAEELGIKVIILEEQYTSKSSFIDDDPIPTNFGEYKFSGKRIKRGLYKSKSGILINADVNGSYNILRKCIPPIQIC